MPGIKGMKHRRRRAPKSNDAQVCTVIENRLKNHFDGKEQMSQTQLKAAELLYSRLRPTLSAVEHSQQDPRDVMTPDELVSKLVALFNDKPELWAQVKALRDAANDAMDSTALKQVDAAA